LRIEINKYIKERRRDFYIEVHRAKRVFKTYVGRRITKQGGFPDTWVVPNPEFWVAHICSPSKLDERTTQSLAALG
jgi:hypothetical protein